jgi:SAM-dependent methyltransferase
MTSPELTADLERLVMKALETPYSSFSATDDSETGNRYQAVGLGDRSTRGMREDRGRFLDALDLRGRTVLDLGSNLGQISREARARGAALVDGFEIDSYFNEIAQLVNVLTGTTGVSFYERDMADPETYREPYDVVLAFSAFRFIADRLDRLAAITDVLVVETHELKGNFDDRYLAPLTEHFPAFRMLGESEVERLRAGGVRAVCLFARDESALLGALAPALRAGGRAAGVLAAGVRGHRIRGGVDELRLDGGRLRVSGWCRHPATPHDAVELSTPADGAAGAPFGTLAVTEPAADGAFEFECEAPLVDSPTVRLDVSAFSESTPLGTMSAYWSPGLGPDQVLGLTVAHDLLEPLGHYRALDSFESALNLDSGLERFLPSLVPNAHLSTGPGDGEFDLVIGHAVDVDEARVAELHRVMRPGAYLTFSVLGELARSFGEPGLRRDDLIGLCAPRFDVMTYVEGGVAGLHDLIVLRRPANIERASPAACT